MRTTLTLDDDLAAALKAVAFERQVPFKLVVNEIIRHGLQAKAAPPAARSYRLHPAALGRIAPGVDLDRALLLSDDLEDEGLAGKIEARK